MIAAASTYRDDVADTDPRIADSHNFDDRIDLDPVATCETNRSRSLRHVATVGLFVVLIAALWTQRALVESALSQMGSMSLAALAVLAVLATYERWSRANIMRRLLGDGITIGQALTIHDVGTAVSKGVPLGGALGTAARWSIVRERNVSATRFSTMLIAYGIATTFVSWLLPFAALSIDLTQRSVEQTDVLMLIGIGAVLLASATFWCVVLHSQRLETWAAGRLGRAWGKLARKISLLDAHDPASSVAEVRRELCLIVRNPWSLLARSAGAQMGGALILLVALRAVGVTDELGVTEFARVFFVTHLLSTFAPTPGGVGVVEAGMTGALVAAGVDSSAALAGVLVYRFLTYVVPIVLGAALYVVWRSRPSRARRHVEASGEPARVRMPTLAAATLVGNGPSIDTVLPYFSRTADQGFRESRHAR